VIWRKIIPVFIACSGVSAPGVFGQEALISKSTGVLSSTAAHTEGFDEIVVPLTGLTLGVGLNIEFGTGFCVDAACQFVGTNYHVAKTSQLHTIEGEKIVHRYFATGPDDEGATVNEGPAENVDFVPLVPASLKYTWDRDLAIFELRHPLRHHRGIPFSLGDLQEGQEVEIYTYPKGPINPVRKLQQFRGAYKGETTTGLLAFDYELSGDKSIRPGSSGGIVVDKKSHQIVGILNGIAKDHEAIVTAVPVESLADFVTKIEPYLAQSLFPSSQGISALSADLYPKYVPLHAKTLEHRAEEPPEVKLLRSKAQALADSMRDFIAVQTFVWGDGDKEPKADGAYEVRVLDGVQWYRSYPDGKKEIDDIPFPYSHDVVVPAPDWSELPKMAGTRLRLKIRQAPDVVLNERRVKVFQFSADIEDGVCVFRVVSRSNKDYAVNCHGEIWTDDDTNILRISEYFELPWKASDYRVVVTYGWLQRADEPRLIPLTISAQLEEGKKIHWCRGQFMNYRVFSAEARIIADQSKPSPLGISQRAE
jgi:Trypsin-like peptidase domain